MYKIRLDELNTLFNEIAKNDELILPVKKAGSLNFGIYEEGVETDLINKTVKSAKDAFFPQFETLYNVKKTITPADELAEGEEAANTKIRTKLEIHPEELKDKEFVVFGMRACDVRGVEVLDNVFLKDPVDTFYKARRDHGILVALACREPDESCFCTVFGLDPADPSKSVADVATWIVGEELFWKPLTEKGESLTESVKAVFADADESALEPVKEQITSIMDKLPNTKLSLEGWGVGKTDEKFGAPEWEKLYSPCLGCGTCTFVCPTCQCYDIKDYTTKDGIQRYRCWDSCMYSDFTLMAGGQNRTTQLQRFRQRFMHKLVYYPDRYDGMFSCVGCGRCVDKCPQSLNIVKVIKTFQKGGAV
jgi:ferredoxin